MRRPVFFILLFLGGVFSVLFTNTTNAQETTDVSSLGNIVIQLTPEFPLPNKEVTAQVASSLFNIDGVPITWVLDGKTQLAGVGKKNFTFRAGEIGVSTSLRVEVETEDFGTVAKEVQIQPSDVDILWEADTYTPPFYKGKALPTSQSFIKILAVPSFVSQNKTIPSNELTYFWKKAYAANPNDSGIGKDTYFYRASYTFNETTVDTTVSSIDGRLAMHKKTKIPVYEPKIIFYENKPLEGIRYRNALGGSFAIKESEVTLRAEPYFFSVPNANDNSATVSWQIDGKKLPINPIKKSDFTLRKPEKGSGSSNISVKITNPGYDLQTGSKNITLSYTN